NNARLFHRSHSPDGGITSNFFDIHPGGGPNQVDELIAEITIGLEGKPERALFNGRKPISAPGRRALRRAQQAQARAGV
ncbi:MAG: hypothetical protein DMG32_25940, partial [Acidobacteria bacterium]